MQGIVVPGHEESLTAVEGFGTYVWRVEDDVLEWSPGLVAIYGRPGPPTDELGFYGLLHPEDRLRIEAETSAFLEQADRYSHEFRIIRADGSVRHIHDRAAVQRAPGGRVIAIRGINIDITDQRAADPEVGFRALADNINQLAWIADREGWIHWYNARWFEFTGTTLQDMQGWGWQKVHHPDHVERVVERISTSFRTGQDWEDTFPLRKADGTYRWFLSRARTIRDAQGNIHAWFGTNTDITEQRELEERSHQLQRQFEALANSMPQLAWTATSNGQVNYYNKRVDEYWSARNLDTGHFDWRTIVHPDDLERTASQWNTAAETGLDYACDHRLRMADGSYRWHLSRAIAQGEENNGAGLLWFGTATDIEDLKRSEQDRQLLLQELNHRVKNTLTLVQSIATLSFRNAADPAGALDGFHARLTALARTHDLLVRDDWQEISLKEVVLTATGALGAATERIEASGDEVRLSGRIGVMVAMAIHELGTNAIKYGALSNEAGIVSINWKPHEARADGFQLRWIETGGPPVQPPSRQGFGSRLIRQALTSAISGEAHLEFQPTGVDCTISGNSQG